MEQNRKAGNILFAYVNLVQSKSGYSNLWGSSSLLKIIIEINGEPCGKKIKLASFLT